MGILFYLNIYYLRVHLKMRFKYFPKPHLVDLINLIREHNRRFDF